MWQTDWADKLKETAGAAQDSSTLDSEAVAAVYLLSWCEHCIECALPDCFSLCPLYVQRLDRKCARFKRGIYPNANFPGLFSYGAEIEFRRWGKLESAFGFGSVSPRSVRLLDRMDRGVLSWIRPASQMMSGLSSHYRLNGGYAVLRELLLQRATRNRKQDFDEFVIEVWNLDSRAVRLVLECWQQGAKFRTSIYLDPGRSVHRIPASTMNVDLYGAPGMIRLYPENDAEAHVAFSWLDFVKYRSVPSSGTALPAVEPPAAIQAFSPKVKCVIWDLDQTAWEGILGEQDPETVSLRPSVLQTMLALDDRGILQSVASKNDHDLASSVLERLGIAHLFLYPQINWQPKSASINEIVSALNIGVDSCVFIDDSAFERAEVGHQLEGIRIFSEFDVPGLLDRPEFDVPITKESKQRRSLYVADSERKRKSFEYGDDYEAFLRTCKMEVVLSRPTEPEQVERCLELLHRSNQLNLSTYRYTREEFALLLANQAILCVSIACRDRFGDYGIVGFSSIAVSESTLVLKDFVLSCRVAQKKLENAWFKWLAGIASAAGYETIAAPYTKTSRNSVLRSTLLECGFVERDPDDRGSVLEMSTRITPPASDVVSITTHAFGLAEIPLQPKASAEFFPPREAVS